MLSCYLENGSEKTKHAGGSIWAVTPLQQQVTPQKHEACYPLPSPAHNMPKSQGQLPFSATCFALYCAHNMAAACTYIRIGAFVFKTANNCQDYTTFVADK